MALGSAVASIASESDEKLIALQNCDSEKNLKRALAFFQLYYYT